MYREKEFQEDFEINISEKFVKVQREIGFLSES